MDLLNEAKKIKTHSIIGIVLIFTIIGMIVTLIFEIIDGIKILTLDWQDTELNDEYSDGITNEEAGIDEEDPSYEEDAYDTEELEDFGQEQDTEAGE